MNLRPYQQTCLRLSLEHYRAGINRQLAVLATGLGKAVLFAALRESMGFRRKVMVLVHREELAEQAAKKLKIWNPSLRVGIEMAERWSHADGIFPDDLVVASVPTMGRKGSSRLKRFLPEEFDAVVADEAHHCTEDGQWARVLDHFGLMEPGGRILSLGMTATPNRSDGKGLAKFFDAIVFHMPIYKTEDGTPGGIDTGYLVPLEYWTVETDSNLDDVHTRHGAFIDSELSKAVNTPERNAELLKMWMEKAYGLRTLGFTVDIQHAHDMAAVWRKWSVTAEAVWGTDPDRKRKFERHRSGEITVLFNCQVTREGYDDPGIRCIILAAPHKAALPIEQEIGRGTRLPVGIDNLLTAKASGARLEKESCVVIAAIDPTRKHKLFDLPALFGLPQGFKSTGASITKVKEEFEKVAKEYPTADLSSIKSLSQLQTVATNISLFHVQYPPEIARMSELAWRKSADGYMLAVGRDLVTISKDLREEYQIRGRVGDKVAEFSAQNLPGAMNVADKFILDSGGVKGYLLRDARWKQDQPSEAQLWKCRQLKITVPPGASKGQVSAAITAKQIAMRAR